MGSRNIGEIDATELGEVIDYQERVKEDPPHTHTNTPQDSGLSKPADGGATS